MDISIALLLLHLRDKPFAFLQPMGHVEDVLIGRGRDGRYLARHCRKRLLLLVLDSKLLLPIDAIILLLLLLVLLLLPLLLVLLLTKLL